MWLCCVRGLQDIAAYRAKGGMAAGGAKRGPGRPQGAMGGMKQAAPQDDDDDDDEEDEDDEDEDDDDEDDDE